MSQSQKRIKILFVTKWFMNRYDPQLGVFIRKHATAAAFFCDVALLCVLPDEYQKKSIEFENKEENGIKSFVVYFKRYTSSFTFLNKLINFLRYVKATSAGLKHIKKEFGEHDITHAYIMLRPALVAWWLKIFRKKPFVISEQWSGYATGKYEEKSIFEKWLHRFVFRKASAVTAVSKFLQHKMIEAGLKNNFSITYNIIEPILKKTSPLPENSNVKILAVADLVDEIKNISGILNVFSEIIKTRNDIVLHIVGHGKDKTMLEKHSEDLGLLGHSVFFHGVKTNEEVYQYLHASDFLIMNSRFETFSLICAEALACGKPVIATRCGGPQEFITAEAGILIDPGNDEQLKHAIMKMLYEYKSYNPWQLMDFAAAEFSAKKVGDTFLNVYKSVLTQ